VNVYWWIAAALVVGCFGMALLGFVGYLWSGEDRARKFSLAWAHWGVVFALASLIIVVFKHLILSLLGA
jgi:hypothetical protein